MLFFKKKQKVQPKNYKTGYNKLAYAASQQTYKLDDYNNKYHKHLEDSGYVLDKELSSDTRHKVYHNPKAKHSIVAYKGTSITNQNDILADIDGIGLNNYDHPEFKKAFDVYDKVKERYGDNILSTGHSLGSTKAIKAAEKYDGEAIVFNPGSSPLYNLNTNKKTKVYRHQDDQVSMYVRGPNVENVPLKKKVTYGFGGNNLALYALDQLDSHTLSGFEGEFF